MASALQSSRELLETKVQLRTEEISALYDVTTMVNQTVDIETVLNDVIKKVTARFKFDTTRIFLFDRHFEILSLRAYYNMGQITGMGDESFRNGQGIIGRVAESGEPALFEDAQTDPSYSQWREGEKDDAPEFRFFFALPIKTKTQVFGVASFSSSESRELTDHDARLLKAICEHIAVAVERTRLFEEVRTRSEALQDANEVLTGEITERKRAQEEVLRQHKRISSLHEIGAAINSTLDQKVLLDSLFAELKSLLPYAAVSVCWHAPELDRLVSIAERNLTSDKETKFAKGNDAHSPALLLSEIVVREEDSLVIEDADLDARSGICDLLQRNGWKGFVGLPLSVEGKVLGALAFYLLKPHQFTKEELEFLATLASQVGIAIFNSVLYENSRKQAIDLERAIHAKDEFLNVMSHELRTPLSVIGGYAQAMSVGVVGEMNPQQLKVAGKIIVQSNELLRMINEILQVGSLQAGSVEAYLQNTNLNDLFSDLQNTFAALPTGSLELNWDIPEHIPVVKTDGDKLKHILQNLIHNAMKFTEQGSVTLSVRCFANYIEFAVKDTGIGIEPAKLPVIFDMFRQVDSSKTRSHGGVGVGLFIVKKYVELLKGKIEVQSVVGAGTVFTLKIPVENVPQVPESRPQDQPSRLIA
jgi:signal transduction histidine kinase